MCDILIITIISTEVCRLWSHSPLSDTKHYLMCLHHVRFCTGNRKWTTTAHAQTMCRSIIQMWNVSCQAPETVFKSNCIHHLNLFNCGIISYVDNVNLQWIHGRWTFSLFSCIPPPTPPPHTEINNWNASFKYKIRVCLCWTRVCWLTNSYFLCSCTDMPSYTPEYL